jgi:hypothetical protein
VEAAIDAGLGDCLEFVRRHVLQAEAGPGRVQSVAEKGRELLPHLTFVDTFIDQRDQALAIIHRREQRRAVSSRPAARRASAVAHLDYRPSRTCGHRALLPVLFLFAH